MSLASELLEAQISNVDPDDAETIMARWDFLIAQALTAERERCARHIELIAADWREAGDDLKVWASEYLAKQIRELNGPADA